MTFVLVGLQRSRNYLLRNDLTKNKKDHALQALFPLRRGLRLVRELLLKFRSSGIHPLLLPALQAGRMRGGRSQGAPDVASREASSPPARPRSSERGGSVFGRSSVAREHASVSSAPSGAAERQVARSQRTPLPAPLPRLLLPIHRSTLRDVVS